MDAMPSVIFVGNARCYHTMDWYRSVKRLSNGARVLLATDLVNSEGHRVIVRSDDVIIPLFNIDRLLFPFQSRFGGIWRNFVKFFFLPIQALKVRKISCKHPHAVFHAHTMYYMLVCAIAKITFIGTPQGSEILVRPRRSSIYRHFAVKALRGAAHVTVDSEAMKKEILLLSGVSAEVVQNGVEITQLASVAGRSPSRSRIVSIRGMTSLYRIHEILNARSRSNTQSAMTFIYPYWDDAYLRVATQLMRGGDLDVGRLERDEMYELLAEAVMVISIPESDSSPRSVYEAIFAGAVVAASNGAWVGVLPPCMQARVVLVDLSEDDWFANALEAATKIVGTPYCPSAAAYEMFDQDRSMRRTISRFYAIAT